MPLNGKSFNQDFNDKRTRKKCNVEHQLFKKYINYDRIDIENVCYNI